MTPATFRAVALSLPDAEESAQLAHPDFRVAKRIYATLGYPDEDWGMVKLTPQQRDHYVAMRPKVFVPVKGAWGRNGATNVRLRYATPQTVRPALIEAWKNVAPKRLVARYSGSL
jgi:hypothetical protein